MSLRHSRGDAVARKLLYFYISEASQHVQIVVFRHESSHGEGLMGYVRCDSAIPIVVRLEYNTDRPARLTSEFVNHRRVRSQPTLGDVGDGASDSVREYGKLYQRE